MRPSRCHYVSFVRALRLSFRARFKSTSALEIYLLPQESEPLSCPPQARRPLAPPGHVEACVRRSAVVQRRGGAAVWEQVLARWCSTDAYTVACLQHQTACVVCGHKRASWVDAEPVESLQCVVQRRTGVSNRRRAPPKPSTERHRSRPRSVQFRTACGVLATPDSVRRLRTQKGELGGC